jgi:hypothetical protein
MAAISTLVVSVFYLIPQMVGSGSIVGPLIGLDYEIGVIIIGGLVVFIVATAGMVSTTWVQFIKGFLLLIAVIGLTVGVLVVAGMGPFEFIGDIISSNLTLPNGSTVTGEAFMSPGLKYKDPLDFVSLSIALILGTAALPHILIRDFTVPKPADARKSTVIAIIVMGIFYMLILFLGLGCIYFFNQGATGVINPADANLSAPLLAQYIGGDVFYAVISSIAFATILGTVSGLIMASAGAIARYLRRGAQEADGREEGPGHLQAHGGGGGDRRHPPGHPVQGAERGLPGGPGVRHRRLRQPPGAAVHAVLEADLGEGAGVRDRHRSGVIDTAHRHLPDHDGQRSVLLAQQSGHRLHPAGVRGDDSGVPDGGREGKGPGGRDGLGLTLRGRKHLPYFLFFYFD